MSPLPGPRRFPLVLIAAVSVASLVALSGCADEPGEPSATLPPPSLPEGDDSVQFALVDVGLDLEEPLALVSLPDSDQLMVAERAGVVHQVTPSGDGLEQVGEVIDLRELVGDTEGERGLLGIAVHPDGDRLYASYTRAADGASQVDEYRLDVDDGRVSAAPSTRRELLQVEQPYSNHNGGHITFGPDGALFLGLGDGGSGGDPFGNAQNPDTLLGKLVVIDVDAAEPDPRIWSSGLRNPWRFSFDTATGDLWLADVGQDRWEEINHVTAAEGAGMDANFGWNLFEGTEVYEGAPENPEEIRDSFVEPVYTYGHDAGCSVTGGVVYRGSQLPPIDGWYLFSDICSGSIRALSEDGSGAISASQLDDGFSSVVGFGEDADGEVYVLTLSEGIHRLTAR